MATEVRIESDFKDYYDRLSNLASPIVYRRYLKESPPKGTALAELRAKGIATIEIKPVTLLQGNQWIVVYTNSRQHNGKGKAIMDFSEAIIMHPNSAASVFHPEANMTTYKLLQVGERRFKVVIQNKSPLEEGAVLSLEEIAPSTTKEFDCPIFSIDYISTPSGLLAVDFNKTPNLSRVGLQRLVTPEEVVAEVSKALLFNK